MTIDFLSVFVIETEPVLRDHLDSSIFDLPFSIFVFLVYEDQLLGLVCVAA